MTPKAKKTINKVKQAIYDTPMGINFSELMEKTKLSSATLQNTLNQIDDLTTENDLYFLPKKSLPPTPPKETQPQKEQPMTDKSPENHEIKNNTPAKKRNKPFTPNPTRGYEISKTGVKIFLDRKASSRTLTLTIADLKELVNAVEKVG